MSEYKLVPVEPTRAMQEAGEAGWCRGLTRSLPARAAGCYRAMLAAAPEDWPGRREAIQKVSADLLASGLIEAFAAAAPTDELSSLRADNERLKLLRDYLLAWADYLTQDDDGSVMRSLWEKLSEAEQQVIRLLVDGLNWTPAAIERKDKALRELCEACERVAPEGNVWGLPMLPEMERARAALGNVREG